MTVLSFRVGKKMRNPLVRFGCATTLVRYLLVCKSRMVLVKSNSGLFSFYFLKYINPKLFKPSRCKHSHSHRAKSWFKKAKITTTTTKTKAPLTLNRGRKKILLVYLLRKTNPNPEKYLLNVKLKYGCMHTHTHALVFL